MLVISYKTFNTKFFLEEAKTTVVLQHHSTVRQAATTNVQIRYLLPCKTSLSKWSKSLNYILRLGE